MPLGMPPIKKQTPDMPTTEPNKAVTAAELAALKTDIRRWATELGFADAGFTTTELEQDSNWLADWLAKGYAGEMHYLAQHAELRRSPAKLHADTVSIISLRMNYLPESAAAAEAQLAKADGAYVSRYALGRDYHKLIRKRLQQLAKRIEAAIGPFGYRVFTDSAPILEKAIARNAGLGWMGKHTLILNRQAGSYFFLGEIYTDLPFTADITEQRSHCGSCTACIDICPTAAIVAPYQLDARRCIAYLTIEYQGVIPEELRPMMGNRIFGCDDCQLVCPWNKYAQQTDEADFKPRHELNSATLIELFAWQEAEWEARTQGMALRRAGYLGWLRNIAIALGNAPYRPENLAALEAKAEHESALVREHVQWAIAQQHKQKNS